MIRWEIIWGRLTLNSTPDGYTCHIWSPLINPTYDLKGQWMFLKTISTCREFNLLQNHS